MGERGPRAPRGCPDSPLSDLCPGSDLESGGDADSQAVWSRLVGGSQPHAPWNSLDGLPPATLVAAGTFGARWLSSGENFIFSSKLRFHVFGGSSVPAAEPGLWVEVFTVRVAGPGRGVRHISVCGRRSCSGMCQCVQLFVPRGHCHTGVLLAPSRERPGCCLPFRTLNAALQAPDSIQTEVPAHLSLRAATI